MDVLPTQRFLRPDALVRILTLAGALLASSTRSPVRAAEADWPEYLGGADRAHYSPLQQITPDNVGALRVAWEFHTGDVGEMQCNPIVVDGVLYGLTAKNAVIALDAATGRERWRFAPPGAPANRVLRGLVYWSGGDERRILFTAESWLYAVDARTGTAIASFGVEGRASLKAGLGEQAQHKYVISTTPGALFDHTLVMPLRLSESADAAPGYLQAFDVRTGKLAWVFRTIPLPGEPGYETWSKDAYKNINVGAANNWAGMAVDVKRGLIFAPTGSAAPDFWGADRKGANLYANCLLALDARTGRLRWHYQFVHHDLWDRDFPSPPTLLTVTHRGRKVEAVAQVSKSGHVLVFNRDTGESLFPIEERPVPKSDLAAVGEETSPTQPVPVRPLPFARQTLTEAEIGPYAENRDELLARFRAARKGPFQPFGLDDTVLLPGFDGGAEWGGTAADRDGILYVNSNQMAWIGRLKETPKQEELADLSPGNRIYSLYCIGCHGPERKGNPAGGIPSMVDIASRQPRDFVLKLVTTGKGMMPGFPLLPESDRQALVDFLFGLEKTEAPSAKPAAGIARAVLPRSPYRLDGYTRWVDSKGYPAISPPWGTLTAIDLNTGDHKWTIPLGEFKELTAKGIPPTGMENYGGPVVTAGGVLFIAATKDGMFRAFDRRNGKRLWEFELPAPGFATPAVYAVGGKQFVVVAAGGTKLGTRKGDSYLAFTLP
jgi:quinoprotein glucose dehydrogenase